MFFVPRVSSYSRAKVSCGWSRILAVFILFLWHASAQGRVGPRDDFVRAPFGTIRLIARDPELSFGGAIFQSKSELRPNPLPGPSWPWSPLHPGLEHGKKNDGTTMFGPCS